MADVMDLLLAELIRDQDSYRSEPLYQLGGELMGQFPISKAYNMSPWERLAAGLLTGIGGSALQGIAKNQALSGLADKQSGIEALFSTSDPAQRNLLLETKPELKQYDSLIKLGDALKQRELTDYAAKQQTEDLADILSGKGARREVMDSQGVTTQEEMTYDPATGALRWKEYGRSQSPGEKKFAEALAEKVAGNTLYGGGFDPEKQAAIEDSMRKELKIGVPTEQFLKSETAFQNMLKAFKDKSGSSDLDLLYGAVQVREPGLAVRQDDQSLITASSGIGGVFADAAGFVTSGRKFTPQMRSNLIKSAAGARDARISLLERDFATSRAIADRRKINPKNILPFDLPEPSSVLMEKTFGGELWQDNSGTNWIINKDANGKPISRSRIE